MDDRVGVVGMERGSQAQFLLDTMSAGASGRSPPLVQSCDRRIWSNFENFFCVQRPIEYIRFDLESAARLKYKRYLVVDLGRLGYVEIEVVCANTPWCPVCRQHFHSEDDPDCPSKNKKSYAAVAKQVQKPPPKKSKGSEKQGPQGGKGGGSAVAKEKNGGKVDNEGGLGGKGGEGSGGTNGGGTDGGGTSGMRATEEEREREKRGEGNGGSNGGGTSGTSGEGTEEGGEKGVSKSQGEEGGKKSQEEWKIVDREKGKGTDSEEGRNSKTDLEKRQRSLELKISDDMDEDRVVVRRKRKRDESHHSEEDVSPAKDEDKDRKKGKEMVLYDGDQGWSSRASLHSPSWSSSEEEEDEEEEDQGKLVPLFGDLDHPLPPPPPLGNTKRYINDMYDFREDKDRSQFGDIDQPVSPSSRLPSSPSQHGYEDCVDDQDGSRDEYYSAGDSSPALRDSESPVAKSNFISPAKRSKPNIRKPTGTGDLLGTGMVQQANNSSDVAKPAKNRKSRQSLSLALPMQTLSKEDKVNGTG
ncbi:hypothetical protein CBR_g57645 [Chara braunii]|uniref:Uncharacterized protein n=1 Tax=Chara braunii TaxID=69332 RepID=A0A388MEA5_CHABU|nr:hypothetical protein CBR_g57645 [Chara braunii]|eukprot:GBG92887.1 hypothetical protein CBR_g57645 [Chara braunii]